ncbi:MAG: cytochrome P450 [Spongiibacter marinus]|uniref:cytochrome P450 n=1 Tax=Spongiibacter marinus TaxID=354246 RepID=UPI003C483B64
MSTAETIKAARKPTSDIDHLPGDRGALPILGDTIPFLTDYFAMSMEKYRKYGRVFRSNALLQKTVVMVGPEANEILLKDSEKLFSSKRAWDPFLDRLFPNGLMLMDFADHKLNRRILQSAFKKDVLAKYVDTMNPMIDQRLAQLPAGQQVMFKDEIKAILLDVAAQVFMGVDIGDDAQKINRAFVHAMEASLAVVKLPIPGTTWKKGLDGRKTLERFVEQHIQKKREQETDDFFSQFCHAKDEDGNFLDDKAVRDHIIFLLFAAHDTTTSTLCSTIYLLAKNPEWQEKLREEFAGIDSDSPSFDQLAEFSLAGFVMQETLRMYPPVAVVPRRTVRETEIFGYRIPANTSIGISPLMTHYLEEWWSEPTRFDPMRFSPERAEHKKHFYQWLPFGGGSHKCIGLNFAEIQVKIVLFHLLKRYRIDAQPGYEMPYNPVPISFPTDGLPLRFMPLAE